MRPRAKSGTSTILILVAVFVVAALSGGGDAGVRPVPAANAPAPSPQQQAVQLRTSLEKVLGQHVFLSARLIRLRVAGDPGYVQAAADALSRNTRDLTNLISQVYGPQSSAAFVGIWESHEASVLDYTRASVDSDEVGRRRALDALAGYPARMGDYLQQLTSGALPSAATRVALKRHIDDQLQLADRVVAGDVAGSYVVQRQDYGALFGLAKFIAAGIARGGSAALPADFDSPQRRLESALGELLGEHWELAVDLMRDAPTGGPTFEAVAGEVNTNAKDLASAVGVLFGRDAEQRFLPLWADHLEALVSYAQAPAGADAQRQAAIDQLNRFGQALGQLLSAGVADRLPAPALTALLGKHDEMLLGQFDATARRDYAAAYVQDYDGYQHMFEVSTTLAGAVGPELAARVPVGGVHTGGGGLAS
jgi:hypothetical protein